MSGMTCSLPPCKQVMRSVLIAAHYDILIQTVQENHFTNCVAQFCRVPLSLSILKSDTDGFVFDFLYFIFFYDNIIQECSVFTTMMCSYSFRKMPKATFRLPMEVETLQ